MAATFATSTFANGVLAIVAGVIANYLAESLGFGPRAPFALAIGESFRVLSARGRL